MKFAKLCLLVPLLTSSFAKAGMVDGIYAETAKNACHELYSQQLPYDAEWDAKVQLSDDTIKKCAEAEKWYEQLGGTKEYAEALYYTGSALLKRNSSIDIDNALEKFSQAEELYEQLGDKTEETKMGHAKVLSAIGWTLRPRIYYAQTRNEESRLYGDLLEKFAKAIKLCEQLNEETKKSKEAKEIYANALNGAGWTLWKLARNMNDHTDDDRTKQNPLYEEAAENGEYYYGEEGDERALTLKDYLDKYPMYLNPLVNSTTVYMFEPKSNQYLTTCETILNSLA